MTLLKIKQIESMYNIINPIIKGHMYSIYQIISSNLRICTIEYLKKNKTLGIPEGEMGYVYILKSEDKIFHIGVTNNSIYERCFVNAHKNESWFKDVTHVVYYASKEFKEDSNSLIAIRECLIKYKDELLVTLRRMQKKH